MIGQILGNYKIVAKLGEGGMGAVYRGIDLMLEREVAVKVLRPEFGSQPQVVERFRSEAVTLAKLNHPNIATLYSFFRQGEEFFMVLEFVRGVTLDQVIQQGPLPCEQAIPLFCQVLGGIDHAHRYGVVHRDIKPANMMLTDDGLLKVLDFGIARILGTARMTKAGHLIGTIEYMPPEQVRGQETDARSDIYSLGMLLYELLTGRVPFYSENEFELMKAQVEQTPVPPSRLNPTIPPAVEEAIMRAVAKDPAQRFQAAGEFRNQLLTAGYSAAGGALDPTLSGSPYSTRPLTNPPISRPPSSNPSARYAAAPSHPPTPPASGEAEAGFETVAMNPTATPQQPGAFGGATPPSHSDASPTDGGLKETRLGPATGAPSAGAYAPPDIRGGQPKETRLGQAHAPFAPGPHPAAQPPPPRDSFFSRLTWVHYAGAGVAALFLLGALVAVPLVFLSARGTGPAQEKPAPQAEAPVVQEQPTTQPDPAVTQGQPPQTDPAAGTQGVGASAASAADNPGTAANPPAVEQPSAPNLKPVTEAARDPARATPRAATRAAAPAPQKAKAAPSAAEAERKRRAALKALEN